MRMVCVAVMSILQSVAALAQSFTAERLEIRLLGRDCANVSQVSVVFDEDESHLLPASPKPGVTCRWFIDDLPSFSLAETMVSLRLRGARTKCALARNIGKVGEAVGLVELAYVPNSAHDLTVVIPATLDLSYLRNLPDKDGGQCRGVAAGRKGMATVPDLMLEEELLELTIRWNSRPPYVQKLELDGVLRSVVLAHAKKKRTVRLEPKDLGAALVRQKKNATPRLSDNDAIALGRKLRDKGLTGMELKVK